MLVAPGIRHLLAPNPSLMTGPGTNTYLIGEAEVLIVDPGPAIAEHIAAIRSAIGAAPIIGSLVTHGHPDHRPAAIVLREQTGAPILGHPALPGVDRALADGEELIVDGRRLVALTTPGHAEDHLALWLPAERILLAGDLVAGVGTVVLSEAPGALTRYLASLQRVLALEPERLLPGHGPVVADGRGKLQEYLSHRAMREQQIVDTLRSGPTTVDRLVHCLYGGTPSDLLPLAARNIRVHLEHLEERGRVTTSDGEWLLVIDRADGRGVG